MLDALPPDQLSAVVAHEHAHLRGRHDLLLEFFSVAHEAVPRPLRSDAALVEVSLLVEALAEGRTPDAVLGAGTTAPARLRLLADGQASPGLTVGAYLVAAGGGAPLVLLGLAWS